MYNEPVVGSGAEVKRISMLGNGGNIIFMNGWILTVFRHGVGGKMIA